MDGKERFLLGRGEKLAEQIPYKSGHDDNPTHPYTLDAQILRLRPMLENLLKELKATPEEELANGQTVAAITLNPKYISRSQFPVALLDEYHFRLIGSKPRKIKPEKGRGSKKPGGVASTILLIAGDSSAFENFNSSLSEIESGSKVADDLIKIENLEIFSPEERLLGPFEKEDNPLEIVVHYNTAFDTEWEDDFIAYANKSNVNLNMNRSYQVRGLLFISAKGSEKAAKKLAKFSFVRAIRKMPKLRTVNKPQLVRPSTNQELSIPTDKALDGGFKVAVFDGGLPERHPFSAWANLIEPDPGYNIGNPIPELQSHGQAVTSALLFGSIEANALERPFCEIDHYRVLGDRVTDESLYDVMLYIDNILTQTNYPLISLSIGPYLVAGDEEVTAWTSMIDDHLGDKDTLATIAVGNDGDQDWPSSRIQVPSDSVNALAVGASTSSSFMWSRAPYSSVGPGRSPGLVKPDVLAFGGHGNEKFRFLFPGPIIAEDCGTSFAAPSVARVAAGLRAYFGSSLTTQAIKSLIIHSANNNNHLQHEVGWGLINTDVRQIVLCRPGEVKILYTGKLEPAKVLRAPIPLPEQRIYGKVSIKATFCYTCSTDPNMPGEYTRAGLNIQFRPHKDKFDPNQKNKNKDYPKTESFFSRHELSNEQELRTDAHKWDTVRSATISRDADDLNSPVFDIHYQAREPGSQKNPDNAPKLSYALLITITSEKTPDLYEKIQDRFKSLTALQPKIDIPVPVSAS